MNTILRFVVLIFLVSVSIKPLSAQWVEVTIPTYGPVWDLVFSGTNLFAAAYGGVFRSTDNGATWIATNAGLADTNVLSLAVSGTDLFVGTGDSGVFRSTNNGTDWTAASNGLASRVVFSLTSSGTTLFAGTYDGVYVSYDNGTHWSAANNGIGGHAIRSIAIGGSNLFVSTDIGGVYTSTNDGANWTPVNNGVSALYATVPLAFSGANLFAGTTEGVYLSTNNGTSWTSVSEGLTIRLVYSFAVSGVNLFAGTAFGGIFLSTNNGTSWTSVNEGLTANSYLYSLGIHNETLFAGTGWNGIWRRQLSEMITDVKHSQSQLPIQYALSQNYPNPFNPSTTISYQLPTQSHVTLKVFDVLGREVATLVNGVEEPGYKSVTFDASKFSGGVYYYRLRAGNHVETKKLLLLR